ncbi:hypothetical protein DY218_27475 [Streptomyces triticagri]|uniref:Uncharacterized protein n=1 Tax=Streptomyces triticagri TaxID=2293568 RepID=A0A372LYE2_9ACTN|nr:hypothetical protein [Streptomyces triticagri]RFU83651.1 hypothetical protein DY218_27475 [Streptomyces triticagri]
MSNTYALITPQGLEFREGSAFSLDKIVDPNYGATSGFSLATPTQQALGLRGMGADVALLMPEEYEPNPHAERIVPALGGQVQRWRGNVALYAVDAEGWPHGLTDAQREMIRALAGAES